MPSSPKHHLDLMNEKTFYWFNLHAISWDLITSVYDAITTLDLCGLTNLIIDFMDQEQVTIA